MAVVHVLDRVGAVLVTELLYDLADSLLKLPVHGADMALIVLGNAVLAAGHRVVMHHILLVRQQDRHASAERAEFLVHLVQGAVGVAALKHRLHSLGHIVQPFLDRLILIQPRVGGSKSEPRARRRRCARHHASTERAKRARASVVVDVVVTAPTLVAILAVEATVAGEQEIGDLLPVRPPACALRLQLTPAGEQLVTPRRVGIRLCVTSVLTHG